ncbi:hypothetical protein AK812_SmicGene46379, partial [Symbiodinium microadriaticum]
MKTMICKVIVSVITIIINFIIITTIAIIVIYLASVLHIDCFERGRAPPRCPGDCCPELLREGLPGASPPSYDDSSGGYYRCEIGNSCLAVSLSFAIVGALVCRLRD